MECKWDAEKAELNFRKHGVTFGEAATVFDNPLATSFPDLDHSQDEDHWITVGWSALGRVLFISHTDRGDLNRIISARKATPAERRRYEHGTL